MQGRGSRKRECGEFQRKAEKGEPGRMKRRSGPQWESVHFHFMYVRPP